MESGHHTTKRSIGHRSVTYPAQGQSRPQRAAQFAAHLENAKAMNQYGPNSGELDTMSRSHPQNLRDISPQEEPQYVLDHETMHRQLPAKVPYNRPINSPTARAASTTIEPYPPIHHIQPIPLPPPTIHLLSFSHNHILHHSSLSSLLSDLVPHPSTHLYTIRAGSFSKPPKHLWHDFTGTHPLIQEHVMQDPRAREAVETAVRDLRRAVEWRVGAHVVLSVSCGAGTHRSVAVVERIRERVEREVGVVARVVHVHRSRRERDPW
ncbi:hypothetical protein B0J11DRAFT_79801 [Dendryphion nanum]|uniref:RapZ C-terminal domain-containing protein n=1 Tax=Dendryphion nanum TaxID=256645 RepID=A0A9P9DGR1_9PLEO|nr:hypothetical protein B0J11DRAFT_79801 [Dendryphion nanum]